VLVVESSADMLRAATFCRTFPWFWTWS